MPIMMKAMGQQQRPFQPVKPANNKYLAKRWDQDIFNTHREKVAAARAVIDNMPPTVHMHLHIKLKKLQFEAERLATIERDNRILLEKMAHVMRNGGIVDHRKHDYTHKSLNKTKRQRELLRITHENLAILKRLTTKDPHYNHKKWLLEWQMNQQYLMNISKYPHPWRQEQSPYITQTQRQASANKRINKNKRGALISKPSSDGKQDQEDTLHVADKSLKHEKKPDHKSTSCSPSTCAKNSSNNGTTAEQKPEDAGGTLQVAEKDETAPDSDAKSDDVQTSVEIISGSTAKPGTVNGVADISVNDVADISVNGVADISVNDVTDTSVNGVADTSVNGVADTSVNGVADTSFNDVADTSVNCVANTSVYDGADTSVNCVANTSVYDGADTSVNGVADISVNDVADTSVNGVADTSVIGVTDTSFNDVANELVNGVADTSVIGVTDTSFNDVADTSVIGVTDTSVNDGADTSVNGVPNTSVDIPDYKCAEIRDPNIAETDAGPDTVEATGGTDATAGDVCNGVGGCGGGETSVEASLGKSADTGGHL